MPETEIQKWQDLLNDISDLQDRVQDLEDEINDTTYESGESETGYCGAGCHTVDDDEATEIQVWYSFRKTCASTPNVVLTQIGADDATASVAQTTVNGFMLKIDNSDLSGSSRYYWYGSYVATVP